MFNTITRLIAFISLLNLASLKADELLAWNLKALETAKEQGLSVIAPENEGPFVDPGVALQTIYNLSLPEAVDQIGELVMDNGNEQHVYPVKYFKIQATEKSLAGVAREFEIGTRTKYANSMTIRHMVVKRSSHESKEAYIYIIMNYPAQKQITTEADDLFDVINFGGGPTGITNACLIKALNPASRVCVLDKREFTTRDFGLVLTHDAIDRVLQTIKQADQTLPGVQELKQTYEKWRKQSVVKTSDIENTLSDIAQKMGVVVLRGSEYGIVDKDKFVRLMQGKPQENNAAEQKLARLLSHAAIIIGADGAHSTVRTVIGGKKTDISPLHWTIQIKYHTKNWVKPVSLLERSSIWSSEEHPIIPQTAPATSENRYKPVTDQFFVTKEIYDAFLITDGDRTRGTSTDPWTILEVEQHVMNNPDSKMASVYHQMVRQLARAERFQGVPKGAKVSVLPIGMYRSDTALKEVEGKICVLAGDAYAGLALRRGANNGQKAAAMLAEAVAAYLTGDLNAINQYASDLEAMTKREMAKVKLRSSTLDVSDKMLTILRPIFKTIGNISKIRKPVHSNAAEWSQPVPAGM